MTRFIDLEARKSSTCKKIKQEEQEFLKRRFWSFKVDVFNYFKTPNGSIKRFRTSKSYYPLGDSQGSFALRSVNGTVGARVVARCALRSPSSQFFRKEGQEKIKCRLSGRKSGLSVRRRCEASTK